MSRRLKQVAVAFVVVFAAAQVIRPSRANPATDPSHTIQSQLGPTSGLVAVLDRSCRDCHSNATVWPGLAQVAPLSWLMASSISQGRTVVNFSEWATYPPDLQQSLLAESCKAVQAGKMPGAYTLVRPETKLSAQDIATICAAAH